MHPAAVSIGLHQPPHHRLPRRVRLAKIRAPSIPQKHIGDSARRRSDIHQMPAGRNRRKGLEILPHDGSGHPLIGQTTKLALRGGDGLG